MSNTGGTARQFIMFQRELLTKSLFINSRKSNLLILSSILFLLLSSLTCKAQVEEKVTNPILFRGVVINGVTQDPIAGVKYTSDSARFTDGKGMFSFFARPFDTITFENEGLKTFVFSVSDTLRAHEYTTAIYMHPDTLVIDEVVILPSMRDLKYEIMSSQPNTNFQTINAENNLRISAYQGMTGVNKMEDPAINYRMLQQKQKIEAFEKGGIPSDKMVSLNPLILVPAVYLLIKGFPESPAPPKPFLSTKELQELKEIHDSNIKKK
jgi:hypothetical protein